MGFSAFGSLPVDRVLMRATNPQETPSPSESKFKKAKAAKSRTEHNIEKYPAFGIQIYGLETEDGIRAAGSDGKVVVGGGYLERAFGGRLEDARGALRELAEVRVRVLEQIEDGFLTFRGLAVDSGGRAGEACVQALRKGAVAIVSERDTHAEG